jgi:uncharacterized phage protein gp47/JayE
MITTPSYKEIINRIRSDISSQLPNLDPTIYAAFSKAYVESLGGRSFDIVLLFQQLEKELFPQTATGEYLERWANYEGLTRIPATIATGPIIMTGTGTVPKDSELSSSDGNLYTTDNELTLSTQSITLDSLTRSGTIATGSIAAGHNLASNITITISGADQTDYNGDFDITVVSDTDFTYLIDTTPATPATGTILASYDGGKVSVTSSNTDKTQNIDSGGLLTLTSSISNVDSEAYVTFDEISGGTNAELDAALLVRILQSRSAPVANFNIGAIEKEAREVSGVTRVLVKPITPEVGDITLLFVRDGEDSIIPTATDVLNVKNALLEIKPANTSDSSVIVTAPTPVSTDYTFTAINPNTSTMKTAIENSLSAFYEDSVTFEEDITEDKYRAAIINTVDPDTGDQLLSFTLSTPITDITVSTDEIGILGTILFS